MVLEQSLLLLAFSMKAAFKIFSMLCEAPQFSVHCRVPSGEMFMHQEVQPTENCGIL